MAGARKHGAHYVNLKVIALAAGSAADTDGDIWIYDAFAPLGLGASATTYTPEYDLTGMAITECVIATYANYTGQATNFAGLRLTHRNAAATVVDQIRLDFNATTVTVNAFVPMNFAVAGGAAIAGGTLTVVAGNSIPQGWTLTMGDTITLDRLSTNATGQATPAFAATLLLQMKSA